jgi:hypothetical protein
MPVNGGIPSSFDSASISNSRWSAKPRFDWLRDFGGDSEMSGTFAPIKIADGAKPLRYQRIGKIRGFLDVVVRLH